MPPGIILFGKTPAYSKRLKSGSELQYGLDHFGLLVDDMDSAAVDLRAKGVEFICEPWEIRPGVKIAFVKGPDHISIELAQRND